MLFPNLDFTRIKVTNIARTSIENSLDSVNEYTHGNEEREQYLSLRAMVMGLVRNLFVDDVICQSIQALGSRQNDVAVQEELSSN